MSSKKIREAIIVCLTAVAMTEVTMGNTYAASEVITQQDTIPASGTQAEIANLQHRVVELVNQERAKYGLGPVAEDPLLDEAAMIRAQEESLLFSHTRPDGTPWKCVLQQLNIRCGYAGENLGGGGVVTPEQIVDAWMNSESHRCIILDAHYHKLGVGIYKSGNTEYWAEEFTD